MAAAQAIYRGRPATRGLAPLSRRGTEYQDDSGVGSGRLRGYTSPAQNACLSLQDAVVATVVELLQQFADVHKYGVAFPELMAPVVAALKSFAADTKVRRPLTWAEPSIHTTASASVD